MKRTLLWVLTVLLGLSLCACTESGTVRKVTQGGREYTIDQEQHTISDGNYTYSYGANEDYSRITITYPDGSEGHYRKEGKNVFWHYNESKNDEISNQEYTNVVALGNAVHRLGPGTRNFNLPEGHPWRTLFIIAMGLYQIFGAKVIWYLRFGMFIEDAEPAEGTLEHIRALGGITILFGILTYFV